MGAKFQKARDALAPKPGSKKKQPEAIEEEDEEAAEKRAKEQKDYEARRVLTSKSLAEQLSQKEGLNNSTEVRRNSLTTTKSDRQKSFSRIEFMTALVYVAINK